MYARPAGVVCLLSDFGASDPYVGLMRGMVKRACPAADVLDLCHEVPPFSIEVGAFFLASALQRFPPGTVHVAVVDPGVGSARRPLAAYADECYWIAPDNGLLDRVIAQAKGRVEVRQLDPQRLGLAAQMSNTFHGRDLFAPVAGMLSAGRFGFAAVGPRLDLEDLVRLPDSGSPGATTAGRVFHIDHYGNAITDLAVPQSVTAKHVRVGGDLRVPVRRTYAEGREDEAFALVNSYDLLEIAVCEGHAAETFGLEVGTVVTLEKESEGQ